MRPRLPWTDYVGAAACVPIWLSFYACWDRVVDDGLLWFAFLIALVKPTYAFLRVSRVLFSAAGGAT